MPRIIRATAPIRIADIGGWTDTWAARRGKVFNIAVSPLVEVRIDTAPAGTREARVVINAVDYGTRYAPALDGGAWGPHPLLEAALRSFRRHETWTWKSPSAQVRLRVPRRARQRQLSLRYSGRWID